MKKFIESKVVDTNYKIGLRTLIILGVVAHVLIAAFAVFFVSKATNHKIIPVMITICIVTLFALIDAYLLRLFRWIRNQF